MKRLILLAILTGCAASTDELYSQARQCKTDCEPLWDAYNSRQDLIAKREAEQQAKQRLWARCRGPSLIVDGRFSRCL